MTYQDQPEDGQRSNAPAKITTAKPNKRNKSGKRNPAVSTAMSAFWRDPEKVADWKIKHDLQMAARRADPDKKWSRRGVPNGMNRKEAEAMRAAASESATATIEAMDRSGVFADCEGSDKSRTQEAFHVLLMIMRSGYSQRLRLSAARTLLEFIKGRPPRGLTIAHAEQELARFVAMVSQQ